MTNNGAKTASLNAGDSYTIPAGYHNGSGKITANSLSSQTGVESGKSAITADAVRSGYQGQVNGTKITGSIGTKAATTIIPGTSDQTIASGVYLAGAQTIKGDANLVADNIKSGTSIFGVTGTYVDSTPIEISTDAGMEAVLTSDNVGKVYKFTGTSDTYTNGDLYVVEVG